MSSSLSSVLLGLFILSKIAFSQGDQDVEVNTLSVYVNTHEVTFPDYIGSTIRDAFNQIDGMHIIEVELYKEFTMRMSII